MSPKLVRLMCRCAISLLALSLCATSAFAASSETAGKRYAVVIGINEYADSSIVKLTTARNDATDLGSELTSAGWDKVFVLKDDGDYRSPDFPSRTNIENRVNLLADLVKPEDTIFFFFSGHGISSGNESSILPVDASFSRITETSIRLSSIISAFNARGLKKLILAIDACRESVSTTKGISVVGISGGSTGNTAALTLYATKAGWYSYEDTNGRNGVFTRFLLDGLEGKADGQGASGAADGVVTFSELAAYLPDATGSYALDRGIRQQAVVSSGAGNSLVLDIPVSRVETRAVAKAEPVVAPPTREYVPTDGARDPFGIEGSIAELKPVLSSITARVSSAVAQSLKNIDTSIGDEQIADERQNDRETVAVVEETPKTEVIERTTIREGHGFSLLQISFVAPLQLVPKESTIYGVAVGAIQTQNNEVFGIQVAPITATDTVGGVQAGVISLSQAVYGVQCGGIVNHSKSVYGMQCGFINTAETVYGLQCGFINTAKDLHGAQFGFINVVSNPGIFGKMMFGLNVAF